MRHYSLLLTPHFAIFIIQRLLIILLLILTRFMSFGSFIRFIIKVKNFVPYNYYVYSSYGKSILGLVPFADPWL